MYHLMPLISTLDTNFLDRCSITGALNVIEENNLMKYFDQVNNMSSRIQTRVVWNVIYFAICLSSEAVDVIYL